MSIQTLVFYTIITILVSACESRSLLGALNNNGLPSVMELPARDLEDNNEQTTLRSKTNNPAFGNPSTPSTKKIILSNPKSPSKFEEYTTNNLRQLKPENHDTLIFSNRANNSIMTHRLMPVFYSKEHNTLAIKDRNGILIPLVYYSLNNTSPNKLFPLEKQNVNNEVPKKISVTYRKQLHIGPNLTIFNPPKEDTIDANASNLEYSKQSMSTPIFSKVALFPVNSNVNKHVATEQYDAVNVPKLTRIYPTCCTNHVMAAIPYVHRENSVSATASDKSNPLWSSQKIPFQTHTQTSDKTTVSLIAYELNPIVNDTTTQQSQTISESSLDAPEGATIPTKTVREQNPNQTVEETSRPIGLLDYKSNSSKNNHSQINTSVNSKTKDVSVISPHNPQISPAATNPSTVQVLALHPQSLEVNRAATDPTSAKTLDYFEPITAACNVTSMSVAHLLRPELYTTATGILKNTFVRTISKANLTALTTGTNVAHIQVSRLPPESPEINRTASLTKTVSNLRRPTHSFEEFAQATKDTTAPSKHSHEGRDSAPPRKHGTSNTAATHEEDPSSLNSFKSNTTTVTDTDIVACFKSNADMYSELCIVPTDLTTMPESMEMVTRKADNIATSTSSDIPPRSPALGDVTSTDEGNVPDILSDMYSEQRSVNTEQATSLESSEAVNIITSKDSSVDQLATDIIDPHLFTISPDTTKTQTAMFKNVQLPLAHSESSQNITDVCLARESDHLKSQKDLRIHKKLQDILHDTELLLFNAARQFSSFFRKLFTRMVDIQKDNQH